MQKKSTVKNGLWEAMRICTIQTVMVMTMCSMAFAHDDYAQEVLDREVTVNLKAVTFKQALAEIGKAANVKFMYSEDQLTMMDEPVTLNVKERKLRDLLSEFLGPWSIEYSTDDAHDLVILKRRKKKIIEGQSNEEASAIFLGDSPLANVTGIVTDGTSGQPIVGVNVIVKGTSMGTATDANGHYSIEVADHDVLVFSFIGYKTNEVQVNNNTIINVTLAQDAQNLQEVTINAGYWNVAEKESTGSISKVTSEIISKQPVSNPLQALEGRMPGVYIQQATGVPGGAMSLQIRGQNSLRYNGNDPLYVVDGVPFTSTSLASGLSGVTNGGNPMSSINPSDIESIEILKDADATAVYGSRGANGVVLITTKKGKTGSTSVTFNVYRGAGKVTSMMNLLNTQQWLEMRHEAFKNDNAVPGVNQPDYDLLTWDTTRNTNWQKKLIGGTAFTTNAQGTVSGGNRDTQFFISGSYYNESSVFPGSFRYKKGAGHFSLTHSAFNDRLKVSLTASYVLENNNLPTEDLTGLAISLAPNAPAIYDEKGNINWENGTWVNPIAGYTLREYKLNTNNLITNATLSYKILDGLHLKSSLGYTTMQVKDLQKVPISSYAPGSSITTGSVYTGDNSIRTWIAEPQLEYAKKFGNSKVTILSGTTFQESIREGSMLQANGFTNDEQLDNLLAASETKITSTNYTQYRYTAVFGRANYDYQGKYIINLTARRDGSSRFGSGKRFANFGAIGAAWVFSNENFIQDNLSALSFGKLSSSYGITGSDQIGDYQYLDTYSSTTYTYQGISGLIPTRLVNPDYAWETNKKFGITLDLGFLQDRISFRTGFYNNRSSNQLVGYSLPLITGNSSVQYNLPATVANKGLEFELSTVNIKSGKFEWHSSVNLTIPTSKLISYPGLDASAYATTYAVGKPISIRKKFRSTGVGKETGEYTFEDRNGNDIGTDYPDDLQALKKVSQNYYGGIQNSLTYRGFRVDIFFQFVKQTGENYLNSFSNAPGTSFTNQPTLVMQRWRQPGDNSSIQKFTQDGSSPAGIAYRNAAFYGDGVIGDASFIRLKNIMISWDVPSAWCGKLALSKAKIYVQGQNLMTVTNYVGMDPETKYSLALPTLRIIAIGAEVKF